MKLTTDTTFTLELSQSEAIAIMKLAELRGKITTDPNTLTEDQTLSTEEWITIYAVGDTLNHYLR